MNSLRFGLEAEYCLAHSQSYKPLWYKDITFKEIDDLFMQIKIDDLPTVEGLCAEPPHQKLMPFIVEGYGLPNENNVIVDALPKGIEIRTPVCNSIDETLSVFETLYARVKASLATASVIPVALSHHPTETQFKGPQNKRRYDYWLWAMEVMTTYGPDINLSFPKEITDKLFSNIDELEAKVNHYAPAIALPTLNAPFYQGQLWRHKGVQGKSYRTFKRSIVAPAIELHANENFRIEFKVVEMTKSSADFYAYFLLVLTLFLSEELNGRATKQERIYDLRQISYLGFQETETVTRLKELLLLSDKTLHKYDFNLNYLSIIEDRLRNKITPADELIQFYNDHDHSIEKVMQHQSVLQTLDGKII